MKHILNNLTEEEKNAIREQHTGGMKVMTENFSKLLNSKLGDSKPLVSEQSQPSQYKVGQVIKAQRDKDNQMYTLKVSQVVPDSTHIAATISGPGQYEGKPLDGKFPWELNIRVPGKLGGNTEMGTFTIVK